MIEIQCTSCHTRYRIDERVLPDETPTFKCSRCGHVFNAEPTPARPRKPATLRAVDRPRSAQRPSTNDVAPESEPASREPLPPGSGAAASGAAQPAIAESTESSEVNPLDRTFLREQPEDLSSGENLSFDFTTEPKPGESESDPSVEEHQARGDDHWEVGETPEDTPAEPSTNKTIEAPVPQEEPPLPPHRTILQKQPLPSRPTPIPEEFGAPQFRAPTETKVDRRRTVQPSGIPEEVAYFATPRKTHSAGWFLGLFTIIAILFAGASLAIHIEPAIVIHILSQAPRVGQNFQPPTVPATLVALHDVHADYKRTKGGETALLIGGTAENVGSSPLHAVLLAVDLLDDAGKQIASAAAFCGNGLNVKMVGEMTPREIEFLQRLDPQKNFALDPARTTPFLLVFIDPPHRIANLRIQVAKAVTVQSLPAPRS